MKTVEAERRHDEGIPSYGHRPELRGGGRSGARIRAFPWRETPLGPLEEWDEALISTLNLILAARFPMFLTWGAEQHLFYNDAYEPALLGKGDSLGRPFHTVFPEAWAGLEPIVRRTLQGEASYYEDHPVPLARNAVLSTTWWSFSYSPAYQSDGSVGGILGVVYETTRRFLAEQALRSSEAALLAVTDAAPNLLWRCSATGEVIWANQRLLTFTGLAGLEGIQWDSHVHPQDIPAARRQQAQSLASGLPFEAQLRLRDASGQYRWFIVRSQQVFNSEGEVVAWCGSATDIDDWRKAIDDLGACSDLLKAFSASDATLLWVADIERREVEALDPEARAGLALPLDGRPVSWTKWIAAIHPDDRPPMAMMLDRVAQGEVVQLKFRRELHGGLRSFDVTGFPMPGPDGIVRRIGGMIVDVTRDIERRIYLIDPDQHHQAALVRDLGRKGTKIRAFDDVSAFAHVAADLLPGCVVLTAREPSVNILRAAGALSLCCDHLPWIAVGAFEGRMDVVVQLMKLGALDVIAEDIGADALHEAALAALAAPVVIAPGSAETDARRRIAELTRREREVLEGLVAGQTNKVIAQTLSLSPRTVETHRAHLMDRLGVSSLAELLRLAAEADVPPVGKRA